MNLNINNFKNLKDFILKHNKIMVLTGAGLAQILESTPIVIMMVIGL